MKNCPLCATEYYDEVKWCPECEYDFPSGAPAPPPGSEEIWSAMEKQSRDLDIPEGPAASIAERITELYLASEGNENDIWKRSPEFLKSAGEYDIATKLFDRWKTATKSAAE
jgi:hypothetical protein